MIEQNNDIQSDIIGWAKEYLKNTEHSITNYQVFTNALIDGTGTAIDTAYPGVGSFAKTILLHVSSKIFEKSRSGINYTNQALIQHYRAQYAFTLFVAYAINKKCDEDKVKDAIDNFIANSEHINTKVKKLLDALNGCIEWDKLDSILNDNNIFNKLKLIIMAYSNYMLTEHTQHSITGKFKNKIDLLSFDFNHLPNSYPLYHISRDGILEKIQVCTQTICLIHADGGYGKSTILKQLSHADTYVSSFEKGYAYSFYAQGKPQDDRIKTHLHNIILDSQEFFEKSIAYFGIDLEKTKEFIGSDSSFLQKIDTNDIQDESIMLREIFSKSRELPDLLPKLLCNILSQNNYLLFLDGMEVLQSFENGAIKDDKLKTFIDLISNHNSTSKIIISSRVKLTDRGNTEQIKLDNLTDDEIENALSQNHITAVNNNITAVNIDIETYRQFLNVPILLNFIIKYAIKDEQDTESKLNALLNSIKDINNETSLANSPEQTGTQTQTILAEILSKLFEGGSDEELQNFLMAASIFDWPMNENEYKELRKNVSSLPNYKDIQNNNIVFLDTNDAIPSFDIHPMVKLYFYTCLKDRNNVLFNKYTNAMGKYYEELYKDCKNVPAKLEERNYIFNSVNFYLKQEDYSKALELFNNCINGTIHIGKYQEHIRAYYILRSCLKDSFELKDEAPKSEKFNIFRALIYFQMTLGKNQEAIDKSIPQVDIGKDLIIPTNDKKIKEKLLKSCFENDTVCDSKLLNQDTNIEVYRYIETIDWYMSVLENYKYSNKNPTDKDFFEEIKTIISDKVECKIKKFWKFQLQLRVDECKYYFEGKYPNNFLYYRKEFKTITETEIDSGNSKLTGHPHNLWFERYFSSVLDRLIDERIGDRTIVLGDKLYKKCGINDMESLQMQLITKYKVDRTPYYQQGLINMMKLKFLQNKTDNYKEYRDNLIEATKEINKSDFIFQAYLDIALCEYLLGMDTEKHMKNIELYEKNTHIKFLELDYKLLKFLIESKNNNIAQYVEGLEYKHRNNRLEAIRKFKKSQSQTS